MDALTFFVEMVKALAWPVTILVIFLFLRRPLMQLVPFLQRFRYGALELDFGRRIQELAMDVQREVPVVGGEDGQEHLTEYMKRLAQLSPRAVILESWL